MKKTLLAFFSVFCFSLSAFAQEPVIELIQTYTIPELQGVLDDFGIPGGILPPDYEVNRYKVTYYTPDGFGNPILATGTITAPVNATCQMPLAGYLHGTTATKTGVPSYGSAELNIGLIFAMIGNVVTLPDFIGLGDSPGLHPYHHSQTTATCSVDLLRIARDHAEEMGYILNDQLFLFGYSQGGHAAMAVHKHIEEQLDGEFVVTASNPMSGAYDISGVQAATVTGFEPYSSPGYLPYIILGLNQYYNVFDDPSEVMVEPYATTLPPLFDGQTGFGTINNAMPDVPREILQPDVIDSFENDPDSPFRAIFAEQDVYDWTPTSPIRMVYCTEDEQVFYQNALVAEAKFLENGVDPDLINAVDLGELDHGGCVEPALLTGHFYFKTFANRTNNIETINDITYPTGPDAMNGSIWLNATGGQEGLSYEWSNGETTDFLVELGNGAYTVTITDGTGCSYTEEYEMDYLLDANEVDVNSLNVYPNPATSMIVIDNPDMFREYTITIKDMIGRTVLVKENFHMENYIIGVDNFQRGTYLVELIADEKRFVKKIILK